jgi:hypothetical protein
VDQTEAVELNVVLRFGWRWVLRHPVEIFGFLSRPQASARMGQSKSTSRRSPPAANKLSCPPEPPRQPEVTPWKPITPTVVPTSIECIHSKTLPDTVTATVEKVRTGRLVNRRLRIQVTAAKQTEEELYHGILACLLGKLHVLPHEVLINCLLFLPFTDVFPHVAMTNSALRQAIFASQCSFPYFEMLLSMTHHTLHHLAEVANSNLTERTETEICGPNALLRDTEGHSGLENFLPLRTPWSLQQLRKAGFGKEDCPVTFPLELQEKAPRDKRPRATAGIANEVPIVHICCCTMDLLRFLFTSAEERGARLYMKIEANESETRRVEEEHRRRKESLARVALELQNKCLVGTAAILSTVAVVGQASGFIPNIIHMVETIVDYIFWFLTSPFCDSELGWFGRASHGLKAWAVMFLLVLSLANYDTKPKARTPKGNLQLCIGSAILTGLLAVTQVACPFPTAATSGNILVWLLLPFQVVLAAPFCSVVLLIGKITLIAPTLWLFGILSLFIHAAVKEHHKPAFDGLAREVSEFELNSRKEMAAFQAIREKLHRRKMDLIRQDTGNQGGKSQQSVCSVS